MTSILRIMTGGGKKKISEKLGGVEKIEGQGREVTAPGSSYLARRVVF